LARRVKIEGAAPILPPKAKAWLSRSILRALGAALLALFFALALALFSFNRLDPALNTNSGFPPENWLGYPGAFAADLLLQTLGLASAGLLLVLLGWAWRVGSLKGLRNFWVRLAAVPVSLSLLAAALNALPRGDAWPFETGLGGLLGQELGDVFAFAFAIFPADALRTALGVAVWAALAAVPFFYALALDRNDWRALARALVRSVIFVISSLGKIFGFAGKVVGGAKGGLVRKRLQRAEPTLGEAKPPVARDIHTPARPKPGERRVREKQQALDFGGTRKFKLPTLDLLAQPPAEAAREKVDKTALEQNAKLLESVLDDFGIQGQVVKVWPGPVVTLYELEPAPGTKSSRIVSLADDIARSMSAISARVATVPGRNVIGIELPNATRRTVFLREILASADYENARAQLPLALGKDISGNAVVADLSAMPHLLVAGTTGSGKSVGLNAMILSLLYRMTPQQCRFIMVDPKMLELSVYEGIPHLLTPVVTEPKKAIVALKWAVREMEERYRAMSKLGVRSLNAYNKRAVEAMQEGRKLRKKVQTGFDRESGEPVFETVEIELAPFPQVVVVIDEMADLMLVAGKDVEASVQRLSQMARAAGIHLIMATQRPSVDVITGTIKANFPTRIAFQVTSKIDSRTILGDQGAEQLLGSGDMLFMTGSGRITRVHGPFVSDQEVEKVVAALKAQAEPEYHYDVTEEPEDGSFSPYLPGGEGDDGLFEKAVEIIRRDRKASTSYLQRRLQIGYNRAATLIEQMEEQGLVSEPNHKGRREVLIPEE
jgi:DNA segregation ATPase FtsK/SpoIIIE, S-DNA-T family